MAETLDQQYLDGSAEEYFGHSDRQWAYMGVTPSQNGKCTKISVEIKWQSGDAGKDISCYLYDDSGGEPGSLLSTFSVVNTSALSTSYDWFDFTIAEGAAYSLVASTQYHIVLYMAGEASNYIHWHAASGDYAGGFFGYGNDGSAWTQQSQTDNNFKQYYTGASGTQGAMRGNKYWGETL